MIRLIKPLLGKYINLVKGINFSWAWRWYEKSLENDGVKFDGTFGTSAEKADKKDIGKT